MSFTVENDPWIDWSVINGPVDSYLYINLNPDLFDGNVPGFENYRDKYKPLEATYNGQLQTQNIVESVFIITQIGTDDVDKAPFNIETPPNPYNYGTTEPTMRKRKPWRIEIIPLNDPGLTIDIKYDSRLSVVSSNPINVGRYDITIRATYVRNKPFVASPYRSILNPTAPYPTHLHNGTYRGFWSSYENKPGDWPIQNAAFFNDMSDSGSFLGLDNLEYETQLDGINVYRKPYKGYINEWKFLVINPCPVTIEFSDDEFVYTKLPTGPTYTSDPQLLDPAAPNAPGNVPMRLTYSGDKVISPLAPPIEIGTYTITATSTDFNYVGSNSFTFTIRNLTNIEAAEQAAEYQEKTDIFNESISSTNSSLSNSSTYASSSNKMTKDEFIETGVLSILEHADIEALGTIKTLAECAQSLPQKLVMFAAAKLVAFILSYIPGLGIINLLTQVMELIQAVQKILALIEFIKENPWAFVNMVLENTGAYEAIGNYASEQFGALTSQFGETGQFVKDVANGLVDVCNLDISGNPIATLIKADNTKTPTAITKFIPATSKQPTDAKAKYDFFQFELRDALKKDSSKVKKMSDEGDTVGVQEYVSMLTAVHELAYNYHDRIAETGSGAGILGESASNALSSTYSVLSDVTNILSSVYPNSSTTSTSSGSTKASAFSVDTLNSGLGSIANTIGGVTAGLNTATSVLSGNFSLTGIKNEFNYYSKEMLKKNPFWSKETIKEYNARVKKIQSSMENNADAIRNNPANAKATNVSTSSSSSGGTSPLFSSITSTASRVLDGSWISS